MPEHASNATDAEANIVPRWGGRVPIVIGAIGHRDIRPADGKLAAAIRNECRKLKKQYGASPFIVLSALAEGADRLIARIAMEELQADLIAVLPMPAADYERDFQTEDSKREFREFLKSAACMRLALAEGEAWKADGEPRNEQYARAGSIIAEHAQILFAIWNGKEARGTGGTADQVRWFERGYAPNRYSLYKGALSPLSPLEPGLRIVIDPATAQVSLGETRQPQAGMSDMRQILKRTDRYNQDAALNRDANVPSTSIVEDVRGPAPLAGQAQEAAKTLSIADGVYRAANHTSMNFANKVRASDAIVFSLALIAVAAFNLVSNNWLAPWLYLGVTLAMLILTIRIRLFSVDNRFLEYRCLAEALRTLFFWRSAGIARPVWLAYLSRQAGVVHWIRHAVRTVEFYQDCRLLQMKADGLGVLPGVPFVKTAWVEGQGKWFLRKELEHAQSVRIWKRIERGAIIASFIVAIALALLTLGEAWWNSYVEPKNYGNLWQLGLGLLAAGGLAARGFLSRRAHLELTKQYASQRQIFETANRMLGDPKSDWKPEEILEKLGDEALQEQSEWVWLRHTKPFEVPTP